MTEALAYCILAAICIYGIAVLDKISHE